MTNLNVEYVGEPIVFNVTDYCNLPEPINHVIKGSMVPEIKQKWIELLRNGNVKKTEARLCRGSRRCVMGVLGDLYIRENKSKARWDMENNKFIYFSYVPRYMKDGTISTYLIKSPHSYVLPDEVMQWAGLANWNSISGIVRIGIFDSELGVVKPISHFNDTKDMNFSELADLIEVNL